MSAPASMHTPRSGAPIAILGVPLDNVTTSEAVDLVQAMVASGQPNYLVTANVDFLVQSRSDVELRRILAEAHLVLCDGMPLVWASRILGNPLPERVAGADLVPRLIELAEEKGQRLFFLGGTPESTAGAIQRLHERHPRLEVTGYSPPFGRLLEMNHEEIKQRIHAAQPDYLFVSFGCPKQEKWIAMHYQALGVPVCAGVGGTIDFLAGQLKRAPEWMRRNGLEWVYRLLQEPRRLLGRYTRDLWVFGWTIVAQWWRLKVRGRQAVATDGELTNKKAAAAADSLEAVRVDGWQRVKLPVQLDISAVSRRELLADGELAEGCHCLLDASGVEFVDSSGVASLVRLQKRVHAGRRELVLLSPSRVMRQALGFMRLGDFFAVAPDDKAAQRLVGERSREQQTMVQAEFSGAATLVRWRGEITAANAEEVWRLTEGHLNSAALSKNGEAVIGLDGVRFIDSSGLGLLIRVRKAARQQGFGLRFEGMQPAVRNVVRLAQLEGFILEDRA